MANARHSCSSATAPEVFSEGGAIAAGSSHLTLDERELRCLEAGINDLREGRAGCVITKTEERAITLLQLNRLLRHIRRRCVPEQWESCNPSDQSLLEPASINLYDVVFHVIVPLTKKDQVSYVEFIADCKQVPLWFVSHWWGEAVSDFVSCLAQHCIDRNLDGSKSPYWVCAYANNQWQLTDDVSDDPGKSSFWKAMRLARGTVSVLDKAAVCYTRIWCGFEVYTSLLLPQENADWKGYMYDMYTMIDSKAVGISDGVAEIDHEHTAFPVDRKFKREKDFPLAIAKKVLHLTIESGSSSVQQDRVHILNAIAGRALNDAPLDTCDAYDKVNHLLRGRFALDTWGIALDSGEDMGMHCEALRNSCLQQISISLYRCRSMQGQAASANTDALAKSLPREAKSLFLDLNNNTVGVVGAKSLGDGLTKLGHLTQLAISLNSNNLGAAGAKALGDAVCKLEHLAQLIMNLGGNKMGDAGVRSLADGIGMLEQLTQLELQLSSNNVGNEGASALSGGISRLKHLTQLTVNLGGSNVANNKVGTAGAKSLADAIGKLEHLTQLEMNLNGHNVADEGAEALGDGIAKLLHLTEFVLNLRGNKVGDAGVKSLGDGIGMVEPLSKLELNLNSNKIGDKGANALCDGIGKLMRLTKFTMNLGGNKVGDERLERLRRLECMMVV